MYKSPHELPSNEFIGVICGSVDDMSEEVALGEHKIFIPETSQLLLRFVPALFLSQYDQLVMSMRSPSEDDQFIRGMVGWRRVYLLRHDEMLITNRSGLYIYLDWDLMRPTYDGIL